MPYWTLDHMAWHERCAIIIADFLRTAFRSKRGVRCLTTNDHPRKLYRFAADTRRELDLATAQFYRDYKYHDAGMQYPPCFKRGEWVATMRRYPHCD